MADTSRGLQYVRLSPYAITDIALRNLRLSSHRLSVETSRWQRPQPIPRAERLCPECLVLEDEYLSCLSALCMMYQEYCTKTLHQET